MFYVFVFKIRSVRVAPLGMDNLAVVKLTVLGAYGISRIKSKTPENSMFGIIEIKLVLWQCK